MKQVYLDQLINKVVQLKLKAADRVIADVVESLGKLGSPEAIIGKPYEQWTQQDLMFLAQIYGQEEKTPLANLIAKKEIERVLKLEAEEEMI